MDSYANTRDNNYKLRTHNILCIGQSMIIREYKCIYIYIALYISRITTVLATLLELTHKYTLPLITM